MSVKLDIEHVKAILTGADLVTSWHVLLEDETMDRAVYRIRCQLLRPAYRLEIRLIQIAEELLYAYQLFTDQAVMRWDNAPHFPTLPSFPHHFHAETGEVIKKTTNLDPRDQDAFNSFLSTVKHGRDQDSQ